jgi:OmcA/MtrC family decaheme c-type cytochrome
MKTNTRFWCHSLLPGLLIAFLALAGCDGDDGAPGQDVDPATVDNLQAQIDDLALGAVESCEVCHSNDGSIALSGAGHQEEYEKYYQDQVIRVTNLVYSYDAVNGADVVTFNMVKKDENGVDQPFNCLDATTNDPDLPSDALNIYFTQYDQANREYFNPSDGSTTNLDKDDDRLSIRGNPNPLTQTATDQLTYLGGGACQSIKAQSLVLEDSAGNPIGALGDLSALNGHIAVYGRDETLDANSAKHISNPKYPFATILKVGTNDYVSQANASACEGCHTRPFLKHAYIYGEVNDGTNNDGNDFYVCKVCHLDNGSGGHEDWQILKDDPARYADLDNNPITAAEEAKYAYKTRLMNDVHMSHNMEFGFPQSMMNCNTCHAGKLDPVAGGVLADAYYQDVTCKSCHAVDSLIAKMQTARDGRSITLHDSTIVPALQAGNPVDCSTNCHVTGGSGPVLSSIHNGYNPRIYADATGTRYSDAFTASVDAASFDAATNILTVSFSAAENPDIPGLAVTDIVPTVVIGLYGYDTKDFIVAAHGRDADRNRLLEYPVDGTVNPRFTTVSAAGGAWEITADLSMWADMITDGVIKRAEIAVLPRLDNADGDSVGLNAPSKTFDLGANAFDDYYPDIVNVAGGCNTCHDQLATTFHNGSRGGNIKACRLCHVPSSGGSHLEMQSRAIDSYVHAIHSFQVFDIGDIDFSDPVEALEHQHHIQSEFPRFGIMNCESCHNPGMYGVPDQSKSLPAKLSASDDVADRNIGTVPSVVTGPAARACGACHRAEFIKSDDAGGLAAFNAHTQVFGYRVEDDDGVWDRVVEAVMSLF